ncbi:MAG: ABC transporter ATP-binding protein [Desulfobacterota bacterium]|nr:ABC transporter ATP-binding protein [Thermodesulfobacteriota bacterium]MDW8002443.1 ABC transporter ATP-binding protein [Deltaproteobacteria bacterium]
MLEVKGVSKSFDGFLAVSRVDMDVKKGEIVAVIGPNGAGKTTLFNLITGILKPDSGKIYYKKEDITGLSPHRISRKGISRSFQIVNVFQRLTVFENVQLSVLSREKKTWDLFRRASKMYVEETEEILEQVGLKDKKDVVSGFLSHGDQKVLEIAIALGRKPEFMILDEPTAGMSPEETLRCLELIQRLKLEMNLTILFCEHDMEVVFGSADRIIVMVRGEIIAEGTRDEISSNPLVQEAYLGASYE